MRKRLGAAMVTLINTPVVLTVCLRDATRITQDQLHLIISTHCTPIKLYFNSLLHLLFFSVCLPLLEYASEIWNPKLKYLVQSLETIDQKSFRWAYGFKKK